MDQRPWSSQVLGTAGVTDVQASLTDLNALRQAFAGCDAVAHCAGINRELGSQTYGAVHVGGTRNVVDAAQQAGVQRLALLSFLRARPDCGSAYHETKWAAEEIVRTSNLEWTVLKPGIIFGRGDHMLDHLTRALCTFPVFVSMGRRRVRPVGAGDVVDPVLAPDPLPADLVPQTAFDRLSVEAGLPERTPFRLADLRLFAKRVRPRSAQT